MRKRTIPLWATLAIAASMLLPALSSHAETRTLKLAFQSAKEHPIGMGAQKFAELVSQKTGGNITVQLFPNGTLGGDIQTIAGLQGGIVDMTALSSGILAQQVKEFVIFDLPFLFSDGREADAVVDGPIGKKLHDKLVDRGLIGLGYWELGFRNLTNSRRPVAKLEDFSGLKIRVIQSPIYVDLFTALGSNAVPMPFPEVYPALEQKVVDGQENPLISIELSKFYEVQQYLSVTRHIYSALSILISKKTWDKLSPAEQKAIQDAAHESQGYQRQFARAEDEKALARLQKSMKTNTVSPAEQARIREKIKPVFDKYAKDAGEPLISELNATIAKVRGGK